MKRPLTILALAGLTSLLLTSGCVAIGNRVPPQHQCNVTLGQQLIDLKKALDAGAITEAEYQAQKARFLDKK